MDEKYKIEKAKKVFSTICRTLDKEEWKYDKDEENLIIESGAQGDDLPMKFRIIVNAENMLTSFISHIPVVIQEDKRLDIAVAVSIINNRIVDGSFDYDITSGHIFFRLTNSYIDCELGEDVFWYMLHCSLSTIDEYNDKFLMLAKGMITIEQLISED